MIFISALVPEAFLHVQSAFQTRHSHLLLTQPVGCHSLCSELHWTAALTGWASSDQPDHSFLMSLATMGSYSHTAFRACSCSLQLCTQITATAGSTQLLWYLAAKQNEDFFLALNLEQHFSTNSRTNPTVLVNKQALPHCCIYEVWLWG